MNPNPVTDGLPRSVEVGGRRVPIETGFRRWIRIMQAADDPRPHNAVKVEAMLRLAYGHPYPPEVGADRQGAVDAALDFLHFNEPAPPPTERQRSKVRKRTWDWSYDAPYLIADFQREYGIDLTDMGLDMHWWRFWALFRGLGESSRSRDLIGIRQADEKGLGKAQKADLRERKRQALLPARNEEEARANTKIRWSEQ